MEQLKKSLEYFYSSSNFSKSIDLSLEILKTHPKDIDVLFKLGLSYGRSGQESNALEVFKKIVSIDPVNAHAFFNLGVSYRALDKQDKAKHSFLQVLNIDPSYIGALTEIASINIELGMFGEAELNYRKALEYDSSYIEIHRYISTFTKYIKGHTHIDEMLNIYKDPSLSRTHKMHLSFALGKVYEDIEDYDESFKFYKLGNSLMRKSFQYSIELDKKEFLSIKNSFRDYFNLKHVSESIKKNSSIKYPKTPIFIVGMPRSGTTLVEQILNSHSKVFSKGESRNLSNLIPVFLPRVEDVTFPENLSYFSSHSYSLMGESYIESLNIGDKKEKLITDKMPYNFKLIGLIKLILPGAKIINCIRDPRDNCMSIYKMFFPAKGHFYGYDLEELGHYFNLYRDIIKFWQELLPNFVYDLKYESLIINQKEETIKLLDFCNLAFEENCLEFHQNKRPIKTASILQVKQPIYRSSINSWKNYESSIRPLDKILKASLH